jgi:5-methyltetrahydropteroyltriglutamate--homocysteine methyltransferase
MAIPTEPIGSIPRPAQLMEAGNDLAAAPFGDDTSTTRETAFAKIRAWVAGTQLAAAELGL